VSAPAYDTPDRFDPDLLHRIASLERRLAQRQRALRSVRARERRLRSAFETAADPLLVLDAHLLRIVEANAQASQLLGYPSEELRALPWSALAPDGAPEHRASIDFGHTRRPSEVHVRTRSGRRLRAEATSVGAGLGAPDKYWVIRPALDLVPAVAQSAHRLARDLEAAAHIQRSLLPPEEPGIEGLEVAWRFRPCEQLAGDNLNVMRLDAEHVALYVLDVSGHGVPAAMLAVAVHGALACPQEHASLVRQSRRLAAGFRIVTPARVLAQLNRDFSGHLFPGQYFTILYGVLHLPSGQLRFASAGHWGPIHIRRSGGAELLHARGFPIGVFDETEYEEHTAALAAGDRLVLYSDGVPEAMAPAGGLFDYPRLIEALEATRNRPLPEALDALLLRVEAWVGGPALQDDVSLLAIEWRGGASSA
jgi:PAS domain S-box-containing protein